MSTLEKTLLSAEVKLLSTASRMRLLRECRRLVRLGWRVPRAIDVLAAPHRYEIVVAVMRVLGSPRPIELIDVGANDGSWADTFRRYVPVEKYVAVEPDPRAFASLRLRFPEDVLINAAAGAASGEATLMLAESSTYSTLSVYRDSAEQNAGAGGDARIEVVRLDDVVDLAGEPSPRVVKIDVQGFEAEVIRGAHDVLSTTDIVVIEAPLVPQTAMTNDLGVICSLLRPYELMPIYFARPGLEFATHPLPIEYDVVFASDEGRLMYQPEKEERP
jgi:FkbM family methyltransferase